MTKRDRHTRIIESFGNHRFDSHVRFHFEGVLARLGLSALTDEAVRELAADLVKARTFEKRINKRNRDFATTRRAA